MQLLTRENELRNEGRNEGKDLMERLIAKLVSDNKDEIRKIAEQPGYRDQLIQYYGLEA